MTPLSNLLAALLALVTLMGAPAPAMAQAELKPPPGPTAGTAPSGSAAGAVLWDPADGKVLYGKEETVARPMASLTKLMTVVVALEAGTGGDEVTVSPAAAALGGASLDLAPGQRLPMESLIAGLALRSGNDAALAVAEHVTGDAAAFVASMNARADELGLSSSSFVNASGLTDDPDHVASPLDLARLAEHAMGFEVFARYAGAQSATVPGLAPMVSRNELLGVYPGATGVKTGFTRLAGLCLVASATRDGRTLYVVLLDSDDSFAEAIALLDFGFAAFRRAQPVAADVPASLYRWAGASTPLVLGGELAATVPAATEVVWRTELAPSLSRPLAAGSQAGAAQLVVDGMVTVEIPLLTGTRVGLPPERTPAGTVGAALHESLRTLSRLATHDRVEQGRS